MKTIRTLLFVAVGGALAAGCSWSSFDDLADETWVDAVGGADGVDPNVFTAIAAPGTTSENAVFVALGRATDSIGHYVYDADGARSSHGVEIRAGSTQFGVLPPEVPMATDPYSNGVGVAAFTNTAEEGDTKLVTFAADNIETIISQNDFNRNRPDHPLDDSIMPTGLAYGRTDVEHPNTPGTIGTDAVLARGAQIAFINNYEDPSTARATFHACYAETSEDTVMSVGAGNFDPSDPDDELIAISNDASGTLPQVWIFDGSQVVAAHPTETQPLGSCWLTPPFAQLDGPAGVSDWGTRLQVGDFDGDGDPDFAISAPLSERVDVYLWDPSALPPAPISINPPPDAAMFGKSLAAGDLDGDGDDELVIGAPDADAESVSNAGSAYVYDLDGASFTLELTVHDAEPEPEQKMGTAVAVVPWGTSGETVLVVAGQTEIFTYFRTALYADVRD